MIKIGSWKSAAALLALASFTGLGQTSNMVVEANFDSYTFSGTYGYAYAGAWGGTYGGQACPVSHTESNTAPYGVNGSLAQLVTYNFSQLSTNEVWTNSVGVRYSGGAAITDWSYLTYEAINSTNPAAYVLSFDIAAFGFLPTVESMTIPVTLSFIAWDDTIFPYDADFDNDVLLRVRVRPTVGTNFTHVEMAMDDLDLQVVGGSFANLVDYKYSIIQVQFEVKPDPTVPNYGEDNDNGLIIDNILVYSTVAPPTPPTIPFTVLDWNMDDKDIWYNYGGATAGFGFNWSANSSLPIFPYADHNVAGIMDGYGVGGSNGWWIKMDNSALAAPNTPAWAGGGMGGGGPVDLSVFSNGDLRKYQISFDARVEGLAEGVTETTAAVQLFLDSPKGNVRLDFPVRAESNWVTSTLTFDLATFNTGDGRAPRSSFATNYNSYTALRTQWQIENAASPNWGYDADNLLVLDNIKVMHYAVGCPPLTISKNGADMVLTWDQPNTGSAKLQSADSPDGTYADVAGATSPYTIPSGATHKYYRTLWTPPAQ